MKNTLFFAFLLAGFCCYGQKNYYKLYNDSIYDQSRFDKFLKTILANAKPGFRVTPTIFHKQIKGDSIINYFTVMMTKGVPQNKTEVVYEQDPVFLILNKKLPEFKLKDLNGHIFSSEELKGKPALINFWSIQCPPCIEEFTELDKLKEKYGNRVNFISISENSKSQVLELLKKKPFSYYHLVDGYGYKTNTLKISSIPKNIFLDKNGNVLEIKNGIPYEPDRTGKPVPARYQFEKILDKLTKL